MIWADIYYQPLTNGHTKNDSDFDEDIVVTRQEEQRDPEAEADFDRELSKMMSESLDSRKFDRKPVFDVPLPMRRAQRDTSTTAEDSPNEGTATPPNTMSFSLMTKKGNRQQVSHILRRSAGTHRLTTSQTRTIEMPSDSHFAIAMKNQQEAERAEQQRIKNLVLNYDLQGSITEQSGTDHNLYYDYFSHSNPNLNHLIQETTVAHEATSKGLGGDRHQHNASLHQSQSTANNAKPANNANARPSTENKPRRGQQARKLQLSDVDWYDRRSHSSTSTPQGQENRRPRGSFRNGAG